MTDSKLLGRLLRRNISPGQIAAFAASSLVGLVIILTSVKFYTDITSTSSADGSTDYLVISHGVSGVGSITGGAEGFTVEEIERMKNQPWVKRLGIFTTAGFSVSAGIDLVGMIFFSQGMEGLCARIFKAASLTERLADFAAYGIFDLQGIVYFLSVSALFVYFTVLSLEKRRWA